MDAIGRTVMHRLLVLVSVVAVALIGLAALGARTDAQEATPVTEVVFDGVEPEVLASGLIPAYPPEPAGMVLLHLRFGPGGRVLIPADDPGLDLVYVEAGAVTIHINVPVVAQVGQGWPRRRRRPGRRSPPALSSRSGRATPSSPRRCPGVRCAASRPRQGC